MRKVIILRKIQVTMKTFTPPFFNHFSLSLKKKRVVMRATRKKLQKQSFADILQNRTLKNLANFTGKHLCWSLFLIKLRLQHKCFPVKFAKFLRTAFFTEHLRWLLLKLNIYFSCRFITY